VILRHIILVGIFVKEAKCLATNIGLTSPGTLRIL